MKKTLIALTLAALPVASMAEVTLFGTIKGGVEVTKTKGIKNTITNANDWDSSIGFKGEEDLGNGLKAIWQLQSKASIDGKSSRNGQRNNLTSFIGLDAGTFGKVRAGNLPDAIKDMGDLNLDASGHGVRALDSTWDRIGTRHTGVRYDTAKIAGFSANLLYSMEDNQRYDQVRGVTGDLSGFEGVTGVVNDAPLVANNQDQHTWNSWVASVGLNYEIAGFFVKYGFVHQNDKWNADASGKGIYNGNVHRIMGGYDANNVFVGLGYQYTKGFDGPKFETSEIALAAAYRIGNVVPRLNYVHGFKEKAMDPATQSRGKVANSKYDQVILGVDYHLSKRTTVISSLGWMKHGDNSAVGGNVIGDVTDRTREQAYSFGLGLSHKF